MFIPLLALLLSSPSVIADDRASAAHADPAAPPPAVEQPGPPPTSPTVEPPAPAAEPPLAVKPMVLADERLVVQPGRGITAKSSDGRFSLTVRARTQVRDTFVHEQNDTNEIAVKTLRLFVHGNVLLPELRYLVQLAL